MESFIAVGVIVIIIGVIGYAIWIAANSIRPNLEAEEQAWQQLAKAHKLNFIRSGSLPDTLVSGTYRGHFLVLRTLENEATGQVQTRVSLQRVRNVDDKLEVYYGCRTCGQSAEVLQLPQGVVALLDNQAAVDQIEQQGVLKVNWLSRRELFDFDRVEIVQASDEDVERFAVQVGNDTDEWRQARYQTMECIIAPNCQITANSPKVLQSIFGKVTGFSEGQLSEVGLS